MIWKDAMHFTYFLPVLRNYVWTRKKIDARTTGIAIFFTFCELAFIFLRFIILDMDSIFILSWTKFMWNDFSMLDTCEYTIEWVRWYECSRIADAERWHQAIFDMTYNPGSNWLLSSVLNIIFVDNIGKKSAKSVISGPLQNETKLCKAN